MNLKSEPNLEGAPLAPLTTGSIDTLLVLSAMVVAALMVFGALDALRARVLVRVGAWLDRVLSGEVLSGAVAEALRSGGAVSAQGLRDLGTVRGYLGAGAVLPLFDAPWAPVFPGIVFLIHPVLGWIALGGALALFGCAVLNDLATRRRISAANASGASALNAADAAVRNADAIMAMGMLPDVARRWQETTAHGLGLQTAASSASGSIAALAKFLRLGLQVSILGTGAYLVVLGQMTAGGMIAASIIGARGLAPMEQLITAWRAMITARAAHGRVRAVISQGEHGAGGTSLPRPKGRVDLEGVSYVPPGMRRPVVRSASFRLEAGQVLGIVGPSGAGKTTLVRLIVGSLAPTAGHVRLDGADVAAWGSADRGRHVGYLPQTIELFAGTVRDNIARLGRASDDAVVAAGQLAEAHETILGLSAGYDTLIGEGGLPVSGGQRQRIGLARAVYGDPALVVLDEPNAHLDAEGEQALIRTIARLRERGTTVVLIAQRTGTMAQADWILVLQEGRITSFGQRETVLDAVGTARRAPRSAPAS